MGSTSFQSKLAYSFSAYIDLKHSLGYKFVTGERLLSCLDSFINENYPEQDTITEDIVRAWGLTLSPGVSPQTQNKRLALLSDLGTFLRLENKNTFVLDKKTRFAADNSFTCRILTEYEVVKIFSEADRYEDNSVYGGLTLSVVLRLMYITGIRPGEALKLKVRNFTSELSEIVIEESKSFKSRRLVVIKELCMLLNKYLTVTGAPRDANDLFLFTNTGNREEQVSTQWLYERLRTICKRASLAKPYPRPYDFRHTFITTRILKWSEQGIDINTMLPFLKVFVGHTSINETWYYFKLIPQHANSIAVTSSNDKNIIPEVLEGAYDIH